MKWESSDLVVGGVVLTALVILAAALLWLSPALAERTYPIYADFERIDGIAEQAPVYVSGFEIGRVRAIEPRVRRAGDLVFRIEMRIRSRLATGDSLLLPLGTRARLVPPAVLGKASIVLHPAAPGGGSVPPGAVIPGERGPAMIDQVQELTTGLSADLITTLATARTLMDTLTRTVASANRTVTTVNAALPPLLHGLHSEVAAAESLTYELRVHLARLAPAAVASMDSVQALVADSRRLLGDAQRLIAEREPEMAAILANLDSTSVLLHHFVRQVSDRPWKLFSGVEPPAGLRRLPAEPAETASRHRP